jgi:hypothetical protein
VNAKLVEEVANAVLYEGYMLYPYRPSSVKNRQRWNFGVVYPRAYSETQNGADNWFMQTECLVTARASAELRIKVRFLQAVARTIGKLNVPLDEISLSEIGHELEYETVDSLNVGDKTLQSWQEAIEREIELEPLGINDQDAADRSLTIDFCGGREVEPVRDPFGRVAALILRTKVPISARVKVAVASIEGGLFKISVRILNVTQTAIPYGASRDEALMQSLLSAHTILSIEGGEFVSAIDPPESLQQKCAECTNIGTWPVLAGEEGQRGCMLSSPIILYDYPQIAPESPGALFDGTEIDEILALRILTLTDDEKREMRSADDRSREILERTEAMPMEHFMKLHGVLRGLHPADEEEKQ